jgi:hypothetical protein
VTLSKSPFEAIPKIVKILNTRYPKNMLEHSRPNTTWVQDGVFAQRTVRASLLAPFLVELTPSSCGGLDGNDREGQAYWLKRNAAKVRKLKRLHGAVLFRGWALMQDSDGIHEAWKALGLTACNDPAADARMVRPQLNDGPEEIYEASNQAADATTHVGMHNENIPGNIPVSALFACFQAAESGGEFLLCDGRRVLRDIETSTLANLCEKKLRYVFADLPNWMTTPPVLKAIVQECLSLLIDLTKPTQYFMLDWIPDHKNHYTLKLTDSRSLTPVLEHPATGEPVWFGGVDLAHKGLFLKRNTHIDGEGKFSTRSFDVRYGDGQPISCTDINHITEAIEKNIKTVAMKPGDAVFLDNIFTMHGRRPFNGTRKHAVVWFSD